MDMLATTAVDPQLVGGGVSVYVSESYSFCRIDALCIVDETIELCTVRVNFCDFELFILNIYRPHSDNVDNFVSLISY